MNEKIVFFSYLIKSYLMGQKKSCPYCDHIDNKLVARRRGIIQLRKCEKCGLMFRYPKENVEFNQKYYQSDYQEGITTQLPSDEQIQVWKNSNFKGAPKNFLDKIEIVKKIVPKGKFLDYGASWGYATYQFGQAGYDAMGFELSVPRGGYAKSKLGVNMLNDFSQLNSYKGNFDIVFSSHVIEHVPVPKDLFNTFSMLLKPGGMMIAFVPNCNNMKRMLGAGFGMHHILALDKSFFQNTLSSHGFGKVTFSSSPYNLEEIKADVDKGYSSKDPDGDELMIIAFKK